MTTGFGAIDGVGFVVLVLFVVVVLPVAGFDPALTVVVGPFTPGFVVGVPAGLVVTFVAPDTAVDVAAEVALVAMVDIIACNPTTPSVTAATARQPSG